MLKKAASAIKYLIIETSTPFTTNDQNENKITKQKINKNENEEEEEKTRSHISINIFQSSTSFCSSFFFVSFLSLLFPKAREPDQIFNHQTYLNIKCHLLLERI